MFNANLKIHSQGISMTQATKPPRLMVILILLQLFKYYQARDNDAVLVGTQPFIVYDNHNPITLSMSDIAASWELHDNATKVH